MKKKVKGTLPTSPEQFRQKMKIEGWVWTMMALKFPTRAWLSGVEPQHFLNYAEYFLGRKVMLLELDHEPDWSSVLHYEFECRKFIFSQIRDNQGLLLVDLLDSVTKDGEIRSLHFTTRLVARQGQAKRKAVEPHKETKAEKEEPKQPKKEQGGKGKSKGNGKKEKKEGKLNFIWKTSDGREICFSYNNKKPCDGSCGRVHICRVKGCGAEHPAKDHKGASPA